MRKIWSVVLVVISHRENAQVCIRQAIAELRAAAGASVMVDVTLVAAGLPAAAVGHLRALEAQSSDLEIILLGRRAPFLEMALAGIESAIGERVFVVDLNEVTPALVETLFSARAHDVVMLRTEGGRLASPVRLASLALAKLTHYRDHEFMQSFAMSRNAAAVFLDSNLDPEMFRSMVAGTGLGLVEVEFRHPGRRLSVRRSLAFAAGRWAERSDMAMRTATTLGLLMAALNLFWAFWVLAAHLFVPEVASGWTTLSLQSSMMFFIMSLILVLIGEHLIALSRRSGGGRAPVIYRGRSAARTRDQVLNID